MTAVAVCARTSTSRLTPPEEYLPRRKDQARSAWPRPFPATSRSAAISTLCRRRVRNGSRLVPPSVTRPRRSDLLSGDDGPPGDSESRRADVFAGEKIDLSTLNPLRYRSLSAAETDDGTSQKFAEKVALLLFSDNAGRPRTSSSHRSPFPPALASQSTTRQKAPSWKIGNRCSWKSSIQIPTADAVLSTDNGSLELTNLEFRLPEMSSSHCPPALLKVRGDLRLYRCRLRTASEQKTPSNFAALIDFYGSGEDARGQADATSLRPQPERSAVVVKKTRRACECSVPGAAGCCFSRRLYPGRRGRRRGVSTSAKEVHRRKVGKRAVLVPELHAVPSSLSGRSQ